MKNLLLLFTVLIGMSLFSCKKKTCPAYMTPEQLQKENDKELRKSMRRRKHKKAKLY